MKYTSLALIASMFLGAVLAFGSFTQFVLVLLFGAVGLGIGMILDGRIDIRSLTDNSRR